MAAALVGLANQRLAGQRRIVLIEERHRFGGGPVQPFFTDSVSKEGMDLLADAVVKEWSGYMVCERRTVLPDDTVLNHIPRPICVIAPEQLHADLVTFMPPEDLHLHADLGLLSIGRTTVDVSGLTIAGDAVLDLRSRGRISSAARIEIEIGSHLPETSIDLSMPVLADYSVETTGLMQYFPMSPHWLIMRRMRYLADGDPGSSRNQQGPAQDAEATRRSTFMFDSPALPIPFAVPSALLPSEVPGAVALALAIAACPKVTPEALREMLANLAVSHQREGAARLQGLKLLAQAEQDDLPFAAVTLADRL
ncbi:hypothetical protein [Novosphingobium taihuense]|uniref:Uncharacterized protein n=1 Tax=Novosphingobium taihuense TaxID=260085 RepID=A0A7W7EVN5_9SPHN|nr:hypothetical protein [Novosphingobium taihuense]MBB4613415.1 hypothetical protein [Novosphingobium taihuense]